MASLKNKIAAQAANKNRPKPDPDLVTTFAARTAKDAAARFAHNRPGGPQDLQWVNEALGAFRLLGAGDAQVYRAVAFGEGAFAIRRV